jgi:hypothetical protein
MLGQVAANRVRSAPKEARMPKTLADTTVDELREIIEEAIEKKLAELLSDPDEGLEVQDVLRQRLQRQRDGVVAGERGEPLEDVARRLGLWKQRFEVET